MIGSFSPACRQDPLVDNVSGFAVRMLFGLRGVCICAILSWEIDGAHGHRLATDGQTGRNQDEQTEICKYAEET